MPEPQAPDGGTGVVGLLLAAGAGTRMGGPKALVRDRTGVPWVRARAQTLREGGCDRVLVTVGAQASMVRGELPDDPGSGVGVVVVAGWEAGMGVSLSAGLRACAGLRPLPAAVLVALVDVPGLTSAAVARILRAGMTAGPALADVLAQASYDAVAGHPVLLGRHHWQGVRETADGDSGARAYLRSREVSLVECGDIADGTDVDTPEQLGR